MPRRLPVAASRLGHLLDDQDSVVARSQLLLIGAGDAFIRAKLRTGTWQPLLPGTYAAHNGAVTYVQRAWSALLYAGDGALLSHDTAAYLARLVDVPPPAVHVMVPHGRRVQSQQGVVVHRDRGAAAKTRPQPGPPRTNVEDTVLDLVAARGRPEDVVALVTNACQRRLTTPARLRAACALRSRQRWRRLLAELFEDAANGVESVLERRYFRDVERAHGLPRGRRQFAVVRDGRRQYRDVYYDGFRVVVELDGIAYHSGGQAVLDRARDNENAARGEVSLRYGYAEVTFAPCRTAAQVAAVLRQRGWGGELRPCRRCS